MKCSRLALLIAVAMTGCGDGSDNRTAETAGGSALLPAENSSESSIPKPVPFEAIDLASDASYASVAIDEGSEPGEVREFTKLKIRFCWCPRGTFPMGSRNDAPGHLLNETQFDVSFSRGFWMQETELTQSQYEQLMGCNPAFFPGPQNPVECVTWTEATEFCRRLSELPPEKEAGNLFRLPTEAEWEYACRAGSTTEFCYGDDEAGLVDYGWYHTNAARTTHPVGEKKANAWGLHDMHGNVAEWCQDFYAEYPRQAATDPRGPESGDKRTLRGGGWFYVPMYARCAHRNAYTPVARYVGLGFRLVATTRVKSPAEDKIEAKPPDDQPAR